MDEASSSGRMEAGMTASSKRGKHMVVAESFTLMVTSTRVNGMKIKYMDMESSIMLMAIGIKECGRTNFNMDMVRSSGKTGPHLRERMKRG